MKRLTWRSMVVSGGRQLTAHPSLLPSRAPSKTHSRLSAPIRPSITTLLV